MKYIKIKELSHKWNISQRRITTLCVEGRIKGAKREGKFWFIPENIEKPMDKRFKYNEEFKDLYLLREKINKCRPLTEGEKERLSQMFLNEYTYNSNAIEGNTLTLAETELVLAGNTVNEKPLKDHLEAIGHRDAFEYIISVLKDKNTLNDKTIKNIHSLVLADKPMDRGVYRKIQVKITGAFDTPSEPFLIEENIKNIINDFKNSKKSFFEKITLFHLKFEGIHPFIDGNGRTGRLILNLMLIQEGFLPINIKFTDRSKYYNAFKSFFKDNDISPMLNLITQYEKERLEDYLEILKS